MTQTALLKSENNIAILAFNKLNTNNIERNISAIQTLSQQHKAIIIMNPGTEDLAELAEFNAEEALYFSKLGQKLTKKIKEVPIPTISAIENKAFGLGLEVILATNIRIGTKDSKYSHNSINLGMTPAFGGTQRLPKIIGNKEANELISTGKIIEAQEAYDMGLIDEVTEENLEVRALQLAKELIENPNKVLEMSRNKKEEVDRMIFPKNFDKESEDLKQCFEFGFAQKQIKASLK